MVDRLVLLVHEQHDIGSADAGQGCTRVVVAVVELAAVGVAVVVCQSLRASVSVNFGAGWQLVDWGDLDSEPVARFASSDYEFLQQGLFPMKRQLVVVEHFGCNAGPLPQPVVFDNCIAVGKRTFVSALVQ